VEQDKAQAAKQADRDRYWAEVRDEKQRILAIFMGKDLDAKDIIFCFKCLILVLNDLDLYIDNFLDFDKKTRELLQDDTAAGEILRVLLEARTVKRIEDKKLSLEERQKALEKYKNIVWGNLIGKKKELIEVVQVFPHITIEQGLLVYHCLSVILLQLDLADTEINMLFGEE